ncbi:MAG TPA: hypothetical protein P5567_06665 [Kiritimatiellia bacterium]|nr:hypothetical protein [Kiritimatiellia bacterium]HRZ12120.1 hypothetical protein [Kiritimatiellia bacterium]HSA18122.1 hypothetical protein [Kiritimatiellia bacterium]
MNAHPPVPTGELEKYSSALTLSDMEIFVFPELLYSLVLANLMSPRLWAWRQDPWFAKLDSLTPYRRVLRLKQFVIDHYEFNLDLDTWGLTTKEREIERFRPWMDEATIAQSNALFGYEGDKYYFSLDIRRHFGLDKYEGHVIPYWKTETLEAMDAFRFKEGYRAGAGECVSLSTLYAAALYAICGIPLEDIFLMGTALHSQNFVDVGDGILTNNRRVVTKAMWFNGTELTAKAQRALRHEQVTIVAHPSGYIHTVYPEATIAPAAWDRFRDRLRGFLATDINMEILANYLRQKPELQSCFQITHDFGGKARHIPAEKVYHYEHTSSFKVSDRTRDKLLEEIEEDEFFAEPLDGRIPLNKFEDFFRRNKIDLTREEDVQKLMKEFTCYNMRASDIIRDLVGFTRLEPRLPSGEKRFRDVPAIGLRPGMTREHIVAEVEALRGKSRIADLAFYAYRDLSRCDWAPFLKAALERSPVTLKRAEGQDDRQAAAWLEGLPNESIYDGARVAQPDEVANYGRGDGLEKALGLAGIWKNRHPGEPVELDCRPDRVRLSQGARRVEWPSAKGLEKNVTL